MRQNPPHHSATMSSSAFSSPSCLCPKSWFLACKVDYAISSNQLFSLFFLKKSIESERLVGNQFELADGVLFLQNYRLAWAVVFFSQTAGVRVELHWIKLYAHTFCGDRKCCVKNAGRTKNVPRPLSPLCPCSDGDFVSCGVFRSCFHALGQCLK